MTGAATSAAAPALQRYGKPDNNKLIAYRVRPIAGPTPKLLTCELRASGATDPGVPGPPPRQAAR